MNAATRRKILFLIPGLRLGGAERVVALLLAHLPRERWCAGCGCVRT